MASHEPLAVEMSFKEKLLCRNDFVLKNDSDDWVSEDDEEDDLDEEVEEECPTIRLTKEEKARLRRPWQKTLIINLLCRGIGYNLLSRTRFKNSAGSEPNRSSRIRLEGDRIESDTIYDVFANSVVNQPKSAKLSRFGRDPKLTRSTRYSQRGKKPIPRILNLFYPTQQKKNQIY